MLKSQSKVGCKNCFYHSWTVKQVYIPDYFPHNHFYFLYLQIREIIDFYFPDLSNEANKSSFSPLFDFISRKSSFSCVWFSRRMSDRKLPYTTWEKIKPLFPCPQSI